MTRGYYKPDIGERRRSRVRTLTKGKSTPPTQNTGIVHELIDLEEERMCFVKTRIRKLRSNLHELYYVTNKREM